MLLVALLLVPCASALAQPEPTTVDDFSGDIAQWLSKPNVSLSAENGCLRADVDFSQASYGWLRKTYPGSPLDVSARDGVRFRARGGGPGCKVSVHLMTDAAAEKPPTLATVTAPSLDAPDWQTFTFAWSAFAVQGSGRPVPPEALRHIEVVNISVTGTAGASVTVWVDDVQFVALTPEELMAQAQTPGGRARIPDDRAFAALLDADRFPDLSPVTGEDLPQAQTALLGHMRSRSGPRYTFDPANPKALTDAMARLSPTYPESVQRSAESLLTHEYTWEGEVRQLSRPIDYVQDGSEWTAVLNRFQFLENVLRAYWFTSDERYAEEVLGQMTEWIAGCPVPTHGKAGRTWHPLEVGVRGGTWLRYYLGLLSSPTLTPEANWQILRSLAEHARFLADKDLVGGAPNMIIVEGTTLASLGIMLPELRDSAQWLARGLEIVDRELQKRVLADGAWEEVTPGYHGWVARSCLGLSVLAQKNAVTLPEGFEARFRSLYEWTLKIAKPDGRSPMLGDASDSGIGGAMAEASAFFSDPQFRYFAPKAFPLSLLDWFGPDAPAHYEALAATEPQYGSLLLEHSRLGVMRTGYRPRDSYLLFDFGPIWSHTHEDVLGIELYALGQTLLWDSGVSNYNMPECRAYYRQAKAHNVVLVDGLDMKLGPDRPRLHFWQSDQDYDTIDAEARFTTPPMAHRRQVLFIKPHYWVIRDRIVIDGAHRYERLFHVREKAQVSIEGNRAIAREGDGPVLAIVNAFPANAELRQTEGLLTFNHGRGPGSSNLPAPVVSLVSDAQDSAVGLVTVLLAAESPEAIPAVTVSDDGRMLTIEAPGRSIPIAIPPAERDVLPTPRVLHPI